MKILDRALSVAGTAKTFALNFWPWLLGAFLLGAAASVYPTFGITRAVYQRATLKAELKYSQLDKSLSDLRAENLVLAQDVGRLVLEARDANKDRIDAVAADVRELGRRVQLCATKSDVRISVTPSGAIEAVPDGQLRDLAEGVREFAEACARERDRDAADHNALIDWLERMRSSSR